MIPEKFLGRMQEMLGEEYPAFLASYEKTKCQSLRLNPQKGEASELLKKLPFHMSKVPWSRYGYYYEAQDQPGKHPCHEAGVYYIQEASAMLPAELLAVKPGERVLDLCAAPGGKSTQLAADMKGQGILFCNEIHPARAKILSENVERMGILNAVVMNETPARLAERFAGWFDKILVDAPCSGEGMFRKNEDARTEWCPENVRFCAERQDEILDYAEIMLKPGGRLVYSTCTFAPDENEGSISRLLKRHPEFELLPTEKTDGLAGGVADWIEEPAGHLERTIRLWPHKLEGEGHFAALLRKQGGADPVEEPLPVKKSGGKSAACGKSTAFWQPFLEFEAEFLHTDFGQQGGAFHLFGEQLYFAPAGMPALNGLKVLRPGLHLGTLKKGRFEPSHALALFLQPSQARLTFDIPADAPEARAYLSGQTFCAEGEKGWYLITVSGFSLGWGKLAGGIMKNHYPKGLRKNM